LKKFEKFPKFLIWLDLPDCEFRLAWLYGKNWSFHSSPIWIGLKEEKKWVWIWFQLEPSSLPLDF
jgi:hypothetical protein